MLLGRPLYSTISNADRPLHFGISNVSCCSANVTVLFTSSELLSDREDSEKSSSSGVCSSEANVFSIFACSCMLLNLDPMIGSRGAIIITPNTTQSAPVILPAEIKETKYKWKQCYRIRIFLGIAALSMFFLEKRNEFQCSWGFWIDSVGNSLFYKFYGKENMLRLVHLVHAKGYTYEAIFLATCTATNVVCQFPIVTCRAQLAT